MHADHPQFTPPNPATEQRVSELVDKLTLEEKLLLLGGHPARGATQAVERVGIVELRMADGPMGVHWWCDHATAYPALLMAAAAWDEGLWGELGKALGKDCRARGVHILLAPGLNIYRSPLCGRNFEYAGEDPYLSARVGVNYVRGVQSMGVSCTVKHYALNFQEYDRHGVSSDVDERTLQEVYLPAFKACVTEGGAGCVMTAYNLVNGIHCSEHQELNNAILKGAWGFDGVVMSDWVSTYDAVAAANGGLDLEMPSAKFMNRENLLPALESGQVELQTIDDKVRRLLRLMVCFGWLDREQTDQSIPLDDPETRRVSLEVARRGLVLLKNEHELLPFDPKQLKKLAVLGPYAHPAVFTGGGSAFTPPYHTTSVLEGVQALVGQDVEIVHARGPEPNPERHVFASSRFECDSGDGLCGEYFNNADFEGAPAVTRIDSTVDFRWGNRSPHENISAAFYSVRWTGRLRAERTGRHRLYTHAYDSVCRIELDGKTLVDTLQTERGGLRIDEVDLYEGPHDLLIEWKKTRYWGGIQFGWSAVDEPGNDIQSCLDLAQNADVAVLCVGFDHISEGEGADRSFTMNSELEELVHEVAKVQSNTVVVLFAGGNVAMNGWIDGVGGLIHAFYPGQEGGRAVAEVLFGHVNPSGKLPATFEKRLEDRSSFDCYHDDDGSHRVKLVDGVFTGYRHFDRAKIEPRFPFGFGLSYTTFSYENLELSAKTLSANAELTVSFDLVNTGTRAGAEVVQLYLSPLTASVLRPKKELKGFARVELNAGERRRVDLRFNRSALQYYDVGRKAFSVEPGDFEVMVGASVADIRLTARFGVVD